MATAIPHFDLPFRFATRGAAVVEQDSAEDIINCVQAVLRYPLGFRDDLPDFGIPQQLFREGPLDLDAIHSQVSAWEPRAQTMLEEEFDEFDAAVRSVIVNVDRGDTGG